MNEFHGDVQGVCARRARAEDHQPATLMEANSHGMTSRRHRARVIGQILHRPLALAEQPGDVVVSDGWPHCLGSLPQRSLNSQASSGVGSVASASTATASRTLSVPKNPEYGLMP
jgi:hypothetical protein